MAVFYESVQRRVVPNWRRLGRTVRLGELGSTGNNPVRTFTKEDIRENILAWEGNESIAQAGDVLGAAYVTDITEIKEVQEAAKFVLKHSKNSPKSLTCVAKKIFSGKNDTDSFLDVDSIQRLKELHDDGSIIKRISILRNSLHNFPRNSIKRVELSRLYSLLGQYESARKSMKIALKLDPNNRFVLRSAARLFIHLGDFELAHAPLRNSEATQFDPWLISAEIAISTIRERHSTFAKNGMSKIKSGEHSKFNISELSSSLATLEMYNGSHKNAKKLFRESLYQPNDNALAQYKWASNFDKRLLGFAPQSDVPNPFEALAIENFHQGHWKAAVDNSINWFLDLPFSKRPVNLGSFVAVTYLEEFELAKELCIAGLYANPNNPTLINNLAFSLASNNDPERALDVLDQVDNIPKGEIEKSNIIALNATRGLAYFRKGLIEKGRDWYQKAIKEAKKMDVKEYLGMAYLYLLNEESKLSPETSNFKDLFSKIDNYVNDKNNMYLSALKKKILDKIHE